MKSQRECYFCTSKLITPAPIVLFSEKSIKKNRVELRNSRLLLEVVKKSDYRKTSY